MVSVRRLLLAVSPGGSRQKTDFRISSCTSEYDLETLTGRFVHKTCNTQGQILDLMTTMVPREEGAGS